MAANSNMHNLATLIKRYGSPPSNSSHLETFKDSSRPKQALHPKDQSAFGLLSSCAQYSANMPGPKILITMPSCWERDARLTLVTRRLEAATSRLEDMATCVDASHPETVAAINSASAVICEPTAAAAAVIEAPSQPLQPLPRSVEDFDKIIKEEVQGFVTASEKIGGLVEQQVGHHLKVTRGKLTLCS
jgi:hypothetical protein